MNNAKDDIEKREAADRVDEFFADSRGAKATRRKRSKPAGAEAGRTTDYRYPNLALAANSFRFIGALQIAFGLLFCTTGLLTPVFRNAAAFAATPWMPLAVAVFGPMLGLTLVVRGVSQAAHGEALLALGDIAVATVSSSKAGRPIQAAGPQSSDRAPWSTIPETR